MKENLEDKFHIICCLFDQTKNSVVNVDLSLNLTADHLDDNLLEQFGDKNMIILQ